MSKTKAQKLVEYAARVNISGMFSEGNLRYIHSMTDEELERVINS